MHPSLQDRSQSVLAQATKAESILVPIASAINQYKRLFY